MLKRLLDCNALVDTMPILAREGDQPETVGPSSGSTAVGSNTRKKEGDEAATPDLEETQMT
jgi:hypothetical protein